MSHDHAHDFTGRLTDTEAAHKFVLAGKATITLVSLKTGARFTYKVEAAADGGDCWFVKVLIGPDNGADYKYLGRIHRQVFWRGRATPKPGDIGKTAPSMNAFDFFWKQLVSDRYDFHADLEVWHEGSCGRCGRALTVPESIASGFGPECIKHVGGA